MKFFLDSAKIDEIRSARELWDIDGVTTNPRHILSSGQPFLKAIQEIAREFEGTDKPISVEVNPHHPTPQAIVEEAMKLAAFSKNFVIKIPATEIGFRALRMLREKEIRVNITLVFTAAQALQAARMDADYVSPFMDWKEANREEAAPLIHDIMAIYRHYNFKSELLVAAIRNGRQIVDAAIAGAHIVTAGFEVYKEAFDHPYTSLGLKRFIEAWDQTPYE